MRLVGNSDLPFPVIGVDQSLTGTGICVLTAAELRTFLYEPPKGLHPVKRLDWFRAKFRDLFTRHPHGHVVLEGYAYSKNNRAHSLGELGGVLRLAILDSGLSSYVVTPSALKKFVSGKGNIAKDQMTKEVFKRFGVDVGNDNEADAAALAVFGLAKLGGLAAGVLPKAHLDSLKEAEALPTGRLFSPPEPVVTAPRPRPRPRAA